MNEVDKILDGLIQRTSDGKLKWSRAADANQFVASVDTISVVMVGGVIGRNPGNQRLEIYNERGELAEVIQFDGSLSGEISRIHKINRLHELARRSALDTQATLDKLVKALET